MILAVISLTTLIVYTLLTHKNLMVENSIVQSKILDKKIRLLKTVSTLNKESELRTLSDIRFLLDNQALSFDSSPFEDTQRYYLPLEGMVSRLGGSYYEDNSRVDISYDNAIYSLDKSVSTVTFQNKAPYQLRGNILLKDHRTFLSLSDIENIFNLVDNWDYDKKQISIFKSKRNIKIEKSKASGTAALIRLEDVAAGEVLLNNECLERMKALADYLYSEDVKFHIAWIPRYKDPKNGIDNNLLEIKNMKNAQFISMLDYMIFRGGVIGLHGYTHQHDDEISTVSSELSKNYNNDVASTTKIIEASIETANKLNIPFSFFESPHYAATRLQQSVIENYFSYVYEPYIGLWNKKPVVSPRNKTTIYVPTPLDYVKGANADELLDRIKNRPPETLASLFYHPSKEFTFINFYNDEDGYPNYTYSDQSPMHKIIKTFKDNGYVTISINQIK